MELPPTHLSSLGVLQYSFPPSSPSSAGQVEDLAQARAYANRDEITVSPTAMGEAYGDKIKMFYDEHMHEDEEIRYILKGAGYFDVRDTEDKWVRIRAEPGDLLILPAGIYHRFTVDGDDVCAGPFCPYVGGLIPSSCFRADSYYSLSSTSTPCVFTKKSPNGRL